MVITGATIRADPAAAILSFAVSALSIPPQGWPLAGAADRLGVSLPEPSLSGLRAWLDQIVTWGARIDLTAARGPEELVDLMLADALMLSGRIARGAAVIDVGTGAGAPGVALALLRPDLAVTLSEPKAKRAAFLRTFTASAGLPGVSLDPRPGEGIAGTGGGAWDVALSRATFPPEEWLDLGRRLVRPEGVVWVFLARDAPPFHPQMDLTDSVSFNLPFTGVRHQLVSYRSRRPSRPSGGAG